MQVWNKMNPSLLETLQYGWSSWQGFHWSRMKCLCDGIVLIAKQIFKGGVRRGGVLHHNSIFEYFCCCQDSSTSGDCHSLCRSDWHTGIKDSMVFPMVFPMAQRTEVWHGHVLKFQNSQPAGYETFLTQIRNRIVCAEDDVQEVLAQTCDSMKDGRPDSKMFKDVQRCSKPISEG